jgi:hypothetical protein
MVKKKKSRLERKLQKKRNFEYIQMKTVELLDRIKNEDKEGKLVNVKEIGWNKI